MTAVSNVNEAAIVTSHTAILTNDGTVYTCGTNCSSSNVAGDASFLAGMSGSSQKTNGAVKMDGYDGRVIGVRATGSNTWMLLDNSSLVCVGDNRYSQCIDETVSGSAYQTTPIVMDDM